MSEINTNKLPKCGCPPRPSIGQPWRDVCTWHIEHYRAAMDGRYGHDKGHPKVCKDMVDKWLDSLLRDKESPRISKGL